MPMTTSSAPPIRPRAATKRWPRGCWFAAKLAPAGRRSFKAASPQLRLRRLGGARGAGRLMPQAAPGRAAAIAIELASEHADGPQAKTPPKTPPRTPRCRRLPVRDLPTPFASLSAIDLPEHDVE